MPLLQGQLLDADQFELATRAWSPKRFVSLCNSVIWAEAGSAAETLPEFTERVNAPDGGIDGQWDVTRDVAAGALLTSGWNVFQYKLRDVLARDRSRILSDLRRELTGEYAKIAESRTDGPPLARYILFTNMHLGTGHRDARQGLREAILKGCTIPSADVQVAGAAELAAILHSHPHLRAAFFQDAGMLTWEEAYEQHVRRKFFGADTRLVGREQDLKRAERLLADERVRAIAISGPHDSGKTRFALEATRSRGTQVVFVADPRSMTPAEYRALRGGGPEVICVVDDPDRDGLENLLELGLSLDGLKVVITQPLSAPASYSYGDRVGAIHLKGLTDIDARELLRELGEPLDYELEDWIARNAGGLPGVIIAAGKSADELRGQPGAFASVVGAEAARRIESDLGSQYLSTCKLLSLLTHVGVAGEVAEELRLVSELFGGGRPAADVLIDLDVLVEAGVVSKGGSFAALLLPPLADHLVGGLARNQLPRILLLFARLSLRGRYRLLARLLANPGRAEELADGLLTEDGPFGSLERALEQGRLLRVLASSVPERVLGLLDRDLRNRDREGRLQIAGDRRRDLVWTLQELLYRRATSAGAIELLWLLAEAENEEYGNNATGILGEVCHPLHPQMPISLSERCRTFQKLCRSRGTEAADLCAYVVSETLSDHGGITLVSSDGLQPFDPPSRCTAGEVRDYLRSMVECLVVLSRSDGVAASRSLRELPDALAQLGAQADPEAAVKHFRPLVESALADETPQNVATLAGALTSLRDELSGYLSRKEIPDGMRAELEECLQDLEGLLSRLEEGGLSVRLRRWAGPWSSADYADLGSPGYMKKLGALACMAASDPSLISLANLEWLLSPEAAKSNAFFWALGSADGGRNFLEQLLHAPDSEGQARALIDYWAGWTQSDSEGARACLFERLRHGDLDTALALQLFSLFEPRDDVVRGIREILTSGQVNTSLASRALNAPAWLKRLSASQFGDLLGWLRESGGMADDLVPLLMTWQRHGGPLEGCIAESAWACLEERPVLARRNDFPACDHLASELAQAEPDRALALLKVSLGRREGDDQRRWEPLYSFGGTHRFWNVLVKLRPRALLSTLLDKGRDPEQRVRMAWDVRRLLPQEDLAQELIELGTSDVEAARVVSSWLTGAKGGFWRVCFKLIEAFPHDEEVSGNLIAGIEREGSGFWGTVSDHHLASVEEVRRILEAPDTPSAVRLWLGDYVQRMQRHAATQVTWEYDLAVDDLREYIDEGDTAQRTWALARILKYATWREIRDLLTLEEIEEALPLVDLPEKKRRMIERALPYWRHAG